MRATGTVTSENVFEETDALPTPAGTPAAGTPGPIIALKPSPVFETDSPAADGSAPEEGEVSKALSFVPEEVDPTFLAELDAASPREVEHAASKIQAVFRGHKTRANLASDRFNRPRTKKSRLRNRKHGRDPPKLRRKHGVVRRGHVHENSTRFGNANRHGVRAQLGKVADTVERSSRHFHAKHIHTHNPLPIVRVDVLPPIKTKDDQNGDDEEEEEPSGRGRLHKGVSGVLPRVNTDGSMASKPASPPAPDDASDLDSDEEEAQRVAALGGGGLEPFHRFAGGQTGMGDRDIECFARSLSEDFTNYCQRGGLRRRHYKAAVLNSEWRACSEMARTQVGPWAGALNGQDQWPGARKMASENLKGMGETLSWRHQQIRKGLSATKVPGLEGKPPAQSSSFLWRVGLSPTDCLRLQV